MHMVLEVSSLQYSVVSRRGQKYMHKFKLSELLYLPFHLFSLLGWASDQYFPWNSEFKQGELLFNYCVTSFPVLNVVLLG